jgi:hypothetical protein
MKDEILEIRMQLRMIDCFICGEPDEHRWGVPVFNGDVVSNDFPDWLWRSGGGGQAVCRECFEKHACGELETFDHYYLHLAGMFTGGDGI